MAKSRTKPNAKKAAFLAAYVECATIRGASRATGTNPSSHYDWLRSDHEYVAAFEQAERDSVKTLEEEARRRAHDGCRRLKFTAKGRPLIDPETGTPYVEHVYSDNLMMFLLKGAAPEKYRERIDNHHSGDVNLHVETRVSVRQLHDDPDYIEYLRHKALDRDCDPGAVCLLRHEGNGQPVANGKAPGHPGPGTNGHRNGQE